MFKREDSEKYIWSDFCSLKMIHRRGNWWIREIKSRFSSQKLSQKRRTNSRAKNFDQLLLLRFSTPFFQNRCLLLRGFCRRARIRARRIDRAFASRSGFCSFETNKRSIIIAFRREEGVLQPNCRQKNQKKNIIRRTANKDIACLRSTVSSLDAKVTFEVRETDFTERCRFKLSVLETDAFALM